MEKNEGLRIIIEDIEVLLDGILLSGISVVGEETIREVNRLSISCDEIGLKEGAVMLSNLEDALNRKRHTFDFNMDEVVRKVTVLGSYIGLIKGKITL